MEDGRLAYLAYLSSGCDHVTECICSIARVPTDCSSSSTIASPDMTAEESRIAKYLDSKRAGIERVSPKEAYEALQNDEGVLLVDTRPASFRDQEGSIPGAVIIERCACPAAPRDRRR